MTNTQARMLHLNAAIERDRAARLAEEEAKAEPVLEVVDLEEAPHPWELWLAIGVGLMIVAIAAAI